MSKKRVWNTCAVCDGPIRADNKYGICNGTLECRRKKGLIKYYRYWERARNTAREYQRQNSDEQNRKSRERYATQRHEEITYLVWSPGLKLVKIGITTGMKMRFKAIRNGCPDAVLLGTLPAGRELERYLHAVLASQSAGGEWFNLGSNPVQVVDTLMTVLQ